MSGDFHYAAPHPIQQGAEVVFRPEWHEAGSIKIDNPKEVKEKLIRTNEAKTIHQYYEKVYNQEYVWWTQILVDGDKSPAGAVYAKNPSGVKDNQPCLMMYNEDNPRRTGLKWDLLSTVEIFPVMTKYSTGIYMKMGYIRQKSGDLLYIWDDYKSENEYYAAIVEKRY